MRLHSAIGLFSVVLVGCNPLSILDKPSGDAQILSAARACFDKGDYTCASEYYNKLSAAYSDTAASENAFMLLAKSGVSTAVFMEAALDGDLNGGKFITKIANALTAVASPENRLNIFHAWQESTQITDLRLKGLIRFVTATSLIAEILAEDAGTPGKFKKSDLVSNPTLCASDLLASGCTAPSGKKLITGDQIDSLSDSSTTDSVMGAIKPTLYMINAAIEEIQAGLSQMGADGKLGTSADTFATEILDDPDAVLVPDTDSPFYRKILIQLDVGANE